MHYNIYYESTTGKIRGTSPGTVEALDLPYIVVDEEYMSKVHSGEVDLRNFYVDLSRAEPTIEPVVKRQSRPSTPWLSFPTNNGNEDLRVSVKGTTVSVTVAGAVDIGTTIYFRDRRHPVYVIGTISINRDILVSKYHETDMPYINEYCEPVLLGDRGTLTYEFIKDTTE